VEGGGGVVREGEGPPHQPRLEGGGLLAATAAGAAPRTSIADAVVDCERLAA
jgi:hypothetical protein